MFKRRILFICLFESSMYLNLWTVHAKMKNTIIPIKNKDFKYLNN